MRAAISRTVSSIITGPTLRHLRRGWNGLGHAFGGKAVVHYFHQPDDPYSQLAAQLLPALREAYKVEIRSHVVSPPDKAAAPEYERLLKLADADAALLARAYGLKYPAPEATLKDTDNGDALRKKLGHYLSAMFYFEGEWYWGVDRLHFLEERLREAGLTKSNGTALIAPVKEVTFSGARGSAKGATLDYFLSFRSPYTYIAAARVQKLAEHYGATLRLRFVLPMVMRGLPVPGPKRMYILLDTKREAERLDLPFGKIVDPVGKPTERGLAVLHQAIQVGKGPAFAESFLRGVFAEGIDAGADAGLAKIAERTGLTRDVIAKALKDDRWRKVAEANREELFTLGLWGVPSFRVNNNRPHWGQDRLWAIEQELQQVNQ
ncbi:MAG: DsbA family protein [Alphaproteobacteria bacterium]|nr:DsbA family protein [Alphaproteobacteria bacterium]